MPARRLLPTALLVVAAAPLLAGPAAAAPPANRGEGVNVPRLSCSGDTVQVSGVVRGVRDVGPVVVTLDGSSGGAWSPTGHSVRRSTVKPGKNTWAVNIAGLPARVTQLRARIDVAGVVTPTPAMPTSRCAPGTEVPEVPAAPLVPLTLVLTAGGVLAVRSRRAARSTCS